MKNKLCTFILVVTALNNGNTSLSLFNFLCGPSNFCLHYKFNWLQLDYNGNSIALPFNFAILDWAAGTRQIINNAQLPDGVSYYNIYGTSYDTPFDVR